MKIALRLLLYTILVLPTTVFSQKTDTLIKKLDSLSKRKDTTGQVNIISQDAYNFNTRITPKVYLILIGSDLKQEFTAPFHFHKKDWLKTAIIAGTAGALFLADEPVQGFALDLRNNNPGVANVSKYVTRFGGLYEVYTLSAF